MTQDGPPAGHREAFSPRGVLWRIGGRMRLAPGGDARPPVMPYDADMTFLHALRQLTIIEGISTLVLFGIAMPLKYFAGMPLAVTIVGSIHGFLFVALVVMLLVAIRKVPISLMTAAAGIVAAIIPGGPFVLDRKLAKIENAPRP